MRCVISASLSSVLLLLLLLSVGSTAQTLTPAEISKVDEIFKDYAKADSPGCALGVYRDGAIDTPMVMAWRV